MVKREQYLRQLHSLRDQNVIKVITGIRRSGKSTLLRQFQRELRDSGVKKTNIITLNLEEMENESLLERHVLHDYVMRLADPKAKNYVFFDEIQNVTEFERLVDSLYDLRRLSNCYGVITKFGSANNQRKSLFSEKIVL
ncbi:MAG: AAA family ATPase [Candidatus Nomurabacteria bacterium]|jgi:predicted AAA+ superfamily ATPase|nr:AAA family ATPase [Candidatus Nomurabacteria bacterium]